MPNDNKNDWKELAQELKSERKEQSIVEKLWQIQPMYEQPLVVDAITGAGRGIRLKNEYTVPVLDRATGKTIMMKVDEKTFQQIQEAGPDAQIVLEDDLNLIEDVLEKLMSYDFRLKEQGGFSGPEEFVEIASSIDLSTQESVDAFVGWSEWDGSKVSLKGLAEKYARKPETPQRPDTFDEPEQKEYTGEKPSFDSWSEGVKMILLRDYVIPETSFLLDWEEGYRRLYDMNYTPQYAAYSIYNYDN